MKIIGYWMENLRDLALPLPQELVGPLPEPVREKVCDYLVSSRVYRVYRGYSWCRFSCGIPYKELGHRDYTDGEWVWPEGLLHYVRVHGIILPDEFIDTVMSGKSPANDAEETASLDFWIKWVETKRPSAIYERLLQEQTDAFNAVPKIIDSAVADILKQAKESQNICLFSGCLKHALVGKKVCARHSINKLDEEQIAAELFQLPPSL